jgi:hypothetical protein
VRRGINLASLLTLYALLSCAGRPTSQHPVPEPTWQTTLAYAQQAVARGQYNTADSALIAFAMRYPNTAEANETQFWVALFTLDPRNEQHSTSEAMRALIAYGSGPGPHEHDLEAEILRRTATDLMTLHEENVQAASQADSARTEADSALRSADSARLAGASRDRSRQVVQHLRDSLDKVLTALSDSTEELDRIKKRLTAPKP